MPTLLDRTFKLNEHGTSVKTEILAGVTTFLTMAYILFVNPTILSSTGMPKDAVFVATCAVAALGRSASESEVCADRVSVCGAAEAAGASPSFSKPPVVEQELAIARASTAMTLMIVVTG